MVQPHPALFYKGLLSMETMQVSFSEILHSKYYNKTISVKCIVSGKSIKPYLIPKKIKILCNPQNKRCLGETCKFITNRNIELNANDDLLKFVDVQDTRLNAIIKEIYKLPCTVQHKIISTQNLERLFISAPTGKERISNSSSVMCYFLGYGVDVNTQYELEGYTTTDPQSQESTCLFVTARKLRSDVESFALTKQIKNRLNEFIFETKDPLKIFDHMVKIYDTYASNVTKIYHREYLHMVIDLVFRSVISFRFDREVVHKGWLDIAVIGDTRCGKGYVAEKLVKYFGVGEVVSGDNASYAGLIGGIDQYGGHRVVSWGKIPINDKGLVVIDEAGEVQPGDWTRLSRVRSEGVAEVVKIIKQMTNARTRLISLMNPPLKTIASYSYGMQALFDVIKAPEDIARFDYALVVSHDEVSVKDINQSRKEIPLMYPAELEQELIMWIWSRKIDQVQFSQKAVARCYKEAVTLSKIYTFAIPLIQGENVRVKIAKIAIAFAGRLYNNIENGQILYVEDIHVQCAAMFLNLIYKTDASGYHSMSILQKMADSKASEKDLQKIDSYFTSFRSSKYRLCKCLLQNNYVTTKDLNEHMNIEMPICTEIISNLLDLNLVTKRHSGTYVKNPAFTSWLKKTMLQHERGGQE